MNKVLIVEDELNARTGLIKIINLIAPDLDIVAETGSVSGAIQILKHQQIDIIFLDIELEDGTGFEILEKIPKLNSKIIFTTAYNQHAIRAFKYSAIDYLLKPIDPTDLSNAIKRSNSLINQEKEHKNLVDILKNTQNSTVKNIVLKTSDQQYVIKINDIIHLEAEGAYTKFITTSAKIIVSKNLKYYQDLLSSDFIRCHQSHLVNSIHIKRLDKKGYLLMSNESMIPISLRKKAEINKRISSI